MNDDITATLYLGTDQIATTRTTTNVQNEIGGWTDGRQQFWFNVKLRDLLGDAYQKYDKFLISLVQIWLVNSATINARQLIIQMGGLNWINSSYEQSTQANNYWISLPPILQGTGAGSGTGTIYDNQSACYVFRKGDPELSIYFRYIDLRTNAPLTGVTLMPNAQLIFKIQPIKE